MFFKIHFAKNYVYLLLPTNNMASSDPANLMIFGLIEVGINIKVFYDVST